MVVPSTAGHLRMSASSASCCVASPLRGWFAGLLMRLFFYYTTLKEECQRAVLVDQGHSVTARGSSIHRAPRIRSKLPLQNGVGTQVVGELRIVVQEVAIVRQRRFLPQLFGDPGMVAQKLVKLRHAAQAWIAAALHLLAFPSVQTPARSE